MRTRFKEVSKGNISFNKNSTVTDISLNETYKFRQNFFKNKSSRTFSIPALYISLNSRTACVVRCATALMLNVYRVPQNNGTIRNMQIVHAGRNLKVPYYFGIRSFVLQILTVEY